MERDVWPKYAKYRTNQYFLQFSAATLSQIVQPLEIEGVAASVSAVKSTILLNMSMSFTTPCFNFCYSSLTFTHSHTVFLHFEEIPEVFLSNFQSDVSDPQRATAPGRKEVHWQKRQEMSQSIEERQICIPLKIHDCSFKVEVFIDNIHTTEHFLNILKWFVITCIASCPTTYPLWSCRGGCCNAGSKRRQEVGIMWQNSKHRAAVWCL